MRLDVSDYFSYRLCPNSIICRYVLMSSNFPPNIINYYTRNNVVIFLHHSEGAANIGTSFSTWKSIFRYFKLSESIASVISSLVFGKRFELSDPTSAERCNLLLNAYHLFGAQRSVGYQFFHFLRHLPGNLFDSKVDVRTLIGFLKSFTKYKASNTLLLTKKTFGILLTAT